LDLFNGALAVSALLLAADTEMNATAMRTLHQSAELLENEITHRTKELGDANTELKNEVAVRGATEEALRRQTLEYESILRAISDLGEGAVVVDMSTRRIRYANDAYCRITGYGLEELQAFDSYLAVLTPEARLRTDQTTLSVDERGRHSGVGELPTQERSHIDAIMRSAEHLLSLVNDVLDIARIEAGQETLVLTPIDAVLLCKEAVNMMASVAHRSGVSLTCDVDGVQCMVKGDRKRLLQVLLNLISNG